MRHSGNDTVKDHLQSGDVNGSAQGSLLGQAVRSARARDDADERIAAEQKPKNSLSEFFRCAAQRSAEAFGSSWAFVIAVLVVLAWAATGPLFGYSDTWQLVINTGTTIVTFLTVFLIQNAQNRDAKAFHLKLDELIHAIGGARNELIDLENLTDEQLEKIHREFQRLAKQRRSANGKTSRSEDTKVPSAEE